MSDDQTGSSPFSGGGVRGVLANTDVQDARCDSYDVRYSKSGGAAAPVPRRNAFRGDAGEYSATNLASARYNIRECTRKAREAVFQLEVAARDEDFMEATAAGGRLTDALSRLWTLGTCREPVFSEIVNILQLALAQVNFENLSVEQSSTLGRLIDRCLLAGVTDESEVRQARDLLRECGFDPWRGLSLREDS